MAIKLGTNNISDIYLGNLRVSKIYNGSGAAVYEYAESTPTSYNITYSVTNGTASGPATINSNGTATITITPDTDYSCMSGTPTVTNATLDSFNTDTGVMVISNPTGDVTITYTCQYKITIHFSITNGHVESSSGRNTTEMTFAAESDLNGQYFYIYADDGYLVPILSGNAPDSLTYSGITQVSGNLVNNIQLTNGLSTKVRLAKTSTSTPHDVYISYTCKPSTDLAGRTFQLPDGGTTTLKDFDMGDTYTYTALDIMVTEWFFTRSSGEDNGQYTMPSGNFTSDGNTYNRFTYASVNTSSDPNGKSYTYNDTCSYSNVTGIPVTVTMTPVLTWTHTSTNISPNVTVSWADQAYRTIKFGTGTPIYNTYLETFLKACATEVV